MGILGPYEGLRGAEKIMAALEKGAADSQKDKEQVIQFLIVTDGHMVAFRRVEQPYCCAQHAVMNACLQHRDWRLHTETFGSDFIPSFVAMHDGSVIYARGFGANDVNSHINEDTLAAMQGEAPTAPSSRSLH
jgi:hypothetical protein